MPFFNIFTINREGEFNIAVLTPVTISKHNNICTSAQWNVIESFH